MPLLRRRAELLLLAGVAACAAPRTPPPAAVPPPVAVPAAKPAPRAVPAPGAVKIGNPYQVLGKTYVPADDRDYDTRGIASWYGPGFHALNTANGERYDQDALTAAHKTLPMPSYVEVENLDNGRRLVVRVNDRGPFVDGRIIDLSRRSAQLLGVDRAGTARVRVRRVFPDAETLAALAPPPVAAAQPPAPLRVPVAQARAEVAESDAIPAVATVAIPAGDAAAVRPSQPPAVGQSFVQVAALADAGRIAWLSGYLRSFGSVVTERTATGLTRVRLGPYADTGTANAALAKVRAAGYTDARLVETVSGR